VRRPGTVPLMTISALLIFMARPLAQKPSGLRDLVANVSDRFDNSWNHQDPKGIGQLFAEDATLVTPEGPVFGRSKIVEAFADRMGRRIHVSQVDVFQALDSNSAWVIGEYQIRNMDGLPKSSGYWAALEVRQGGVLRIRMGIFNVTPQR
jgi:uncharacterized protein (TIGR02246 family)